MEAIDNGDGTVSDRRSGLVWQKEDDGIERTYDEAAAYCRELHLGGRGGWRLPILQELLSIVVRDTPTYHDPAFAGAKRERYWTSSPLLGHQATKPGLEVAYTVDFADGHETTYFKVNKYLVRAVCAGRQIP